MYQVISITESQISGSVTLKGITKNINSQHANRTLVMMSCEGSKVFAF